MGSDISDLEDENMDFMLRTKDTGEPNVERILARGFVVLGGLFWTLAFFAVNTKASYATFIYSLPEVERAVMYALFPLVLTIAVFVLGLFYERLTGVVLLLAAAAMLLYGAVFAPRRSRLVGHRGRRAGRADHCGGDSLLLRSAHAGVPGAQEAPRGGLTASARPEFYVSARVRSSAAASSAATSTSSV